MEQARLSLPAACLAPRSRWERAWGLGAGLLAQRPCLDCGAWVGDAGLGALCARCWGGLQWLKKPQLKPRAGGPQALGAALAYEGRLRLALTAYKFEGRASLRRPLARLLEAGVRRWAGKRAYDLATSPPPSRRSLKERGRDCAGELARKAAAGLGLPWRPLLARRKETARQSELDRPGRLANARGAFSAVEELRGARVLLLDDIHTTGATLAEAARALFEAGAGRVEALALARS